MPASNRDVSESDLAVRFARDVLPLVDELYGFAWRLTRRRVDAEDLLQETMTKAYARFETYHDGTNVRAWLLRVM